MFHIVLFEPEIPPNTGNIIRLSANCGAELHLIEPLGFDLSDKQLRRAGMDYRDIAHVSQHKNWHAFVARMQEVNPEGRFTTLSTKHSKHYSDFRYQPNDILIFGSESKGLTDEIRDYPEPDARLTLPMSANSRSLNLSNTVAIVVYDAWRQNDFQ